MENTFGCLQYVFIARLSLFYFSSQLLFVVAKGKGKDKCRDVPFLESKYSGREYFLEVNRQDGSSRALNNLNLN
jgi:hypothetical protein